MKNVRVRQTTFTLLLLASSLLAQAPACLQSDAPDPVMADCVRAEFLHAWSGYKQYAWGYDELKPLSKSHRDWYDHSLLMTPVDALDTMLLMGLTKEADEDRELIATKLSFNQDLDVKVFEIDIRLLGGLLSSYQMTGDKRLLALAQDLGDRLLPAFNTPTGMPYRYVNLKTGKTRDPHSNPAEVGSLILEFGTLSKLTGKPIYFDKAKHALVAVYDRRSKLGLVGSTINVETGKWEDTTAHISGGIDSYYEYLLKCARLFGDKDCKRMARESFAAVNQHLADEQPSGLWYRQVDMNTGKTVSTRFGALDAFFPAELALSGDLDRARRLEDSAYKMWTTFGVEPEEIDYTTMKLTYDGYALRPEIIESAYYLHYFTGDPKYTAMGRTFYASLVRCCRVAAGYADLKHVQPPEQSDRMESFFLAETLKYLDLDFAPKQTLDLDHVVFNTEAHPLRRTW